MKRIDRIEEKLDSIDKTLAVNTESLQAHMKRSDAIESIVLPLKAERDMVAGALKFIGLVTTISGAGMAVIEIIKFFKGM